MSKPSIRLTKGQQQFADYMLERLRHEEACKRAMAKVTETSCRISGCRLERLDGNNLPLPKYATKYSAGIDFAACLTRQCFEVKQELSQKFIGGVFAGPSDRVSKIPFKCFNKLRNSTTIANNRLYNSSETPTNDNSVTDISLIIRPGETILVPLGWTCDFNTYYTNGTINNSIKNSVMKLYVRSSIGLRGLSLANGTGIIDSDYRGELMACIFNHSGNEVIIEHGERIVQGIIQEYSELSIYEVSGLTQTERGEGGFGSTGVSNPVNGDGSKKRKLD
jgi:dUTP pyrophosphatase